MKPRKREVTQEKGRIHRKEEKYSSENRVRSLCFIYAQAIKKNIFQYRQKNVPTEHICKQLLMISSRHTLYLNYKCLKV
jgi:hypothetical protein